VRYSAHRFESLASSGPRTNGDPLGSTTAVLVLACKDAERSWVQGVIQ
jgi:hypothetical protein